MDIRIALRLGVLCGAAAGVVTVALTADGPAPVDTPVPARATSYVANPAGTGVLNGSLSGFRTDSGTATGFSSRPARPRTSVRAGLEQSLAAAAPTTAGVVDETRPHTHVVDPETGGLISVAGAQGVVADADELGQIHADPMPAGTTASDPTDTPSLLAKAGLVQQRRALAGSPLAADGTAPVGTPSVAALARHVVPSCSGTGTDGHRVQVVYVHAASKPSRLSSVLPILREEVADVDDVFAESARQTGGERRVRWVHDADCLPVISDVTVPDEALGSDIWRTVAALDRQGFDRTDRKYLMFADAAKLCGVGTIYDDDYPTRNANDGYAASYARVDTSCWSTSSSVASHELTHMLGGVQGSAPHSTPFSHCYDESDRMCYDDGSGVPMRQVCAASTGQEKLLDCNHDDYFNTDPRPGSYLATKWNVARSSFLDTVVTPPPPAVTLRASATSAQSGDRVRFSATASRSVSWAWSTSASGAACTLTPAGAAATLTCPAAVTGTVTVAARGTDAVTTRSGAASASVSLTTAAAPAARVTTPTGAVAGTAFPVGVVATGKADLGYTWRVSGCTVDRPTAPAANVTCPTTLPARDLEVEVAVRQADGQRVRAASTVRLTSSATANSGATSPAATETTRWSAATLRGSVVEAVLADADGAALAGRPATLQAQWYGESSWTPLREVVTDPTGRAGAPTSYPRAGTFRFVSVDRGSLRGAVSAGVFRKADARLTVAQPSSTRLTGSLRSPDGTPLVGETVVLERRPSASSGWTRLATERSDSAGVVLRSGALTRGADYRWVFAGTAQLAAATSAGLTAR